MKNVCRAVVVSVVLFGLSAGCNKARVAPSGGAGEAAERVNARPAPPPGVWDGAIDTDWYNDDAAEFVIASAAQLAGLAQIANSGDGFRGKSVKLGANIMLNDTADWRGWADNPPYNDYWEPIGYDDNRFRGVFDGNGFTVSGLYIDEPFDDDNGLFGVVGHGGTVKGLGVAASYVRGGDYVGLLAGGSAGIIIGCNSSGETVGDSIVGGLVGVNDGVIIGSCSAGYVLGGINVGGFLGANRKGVVNASYSTAEVSGDSAVGGFVGADWGVAVSGNFSAGAVTGRADVGGFAGRNVYGVTKGNYYDKEASGQSVGVGGGIGAAEGKATAQMQSKEIADSLNMVTGIIKAGAWVYAPGGYPALSSQIADTVGIGRYFAGGDGAPGSPYMINTKEQLEEFSYLVNIGVDFSGKHVKLGANITLNDTANWRDWASNPPANAWVPIGIEEEHGFSGTFDGGGYAVSGVYIGGSDGFMKGLFGAVDSGGTIKNLGVTASYIGGPGVIGGLAGTNCGTVSSSYSTAYVAGTKLIIGGLVGINCDGGTISGCYAAGNVSGNYAKPTGRDNIGGLVGVNTKSSTIIDSYAAGAVSAAVAENGNACCKIIDGANAGGLVGGNWGTVSSSYSTGSVTGKAGYVGGLFGYNKGEVRVSYYESQTSGKIDAQKDTSGAQDSGVGKTTAQMKQKATFAGWDFDKVWGIDGKINGGYPYLREKRVKP